MRPVPGLIAASVLFLGLRAAGAQQAPVPPDSTLSPASAAPQTQPQPDLRTDSKPRTDLSPSTDSGPAPETLGMDATSFLDVGYDYATPVIPPKMVGTLAADDPALVYLSLAHRWAAEIKAADAALIAAHGPEIDALAGRNHIDVKDQGWSYEQVLFPATSSGPVVLQYRREDAKGPAVFAAVLPRDQGTVRVFPIAHGKTSLPKKGHGRREWQVLKGKRAGVVNDVLPPAELFRDLEPNQDWLAASACIAELDGARPSIPVLPELEPVLAAAPAPLLQLRLNGSRTLTFSDREAEDRVSVWSASVTRHGQLRRAEQKTYRLAQLPITNPPVPAPVTIANLPQPPVKRMPAPPSPLSGQQQ